MRPESRHRRCGMSLVELLVVVAILGMLAVTVLPNLSNTAEARRGREAARMVSSFIAKAQSRAIGRREWSGLALRTPGASGYAASDMFLADVPAVYRGDSVDATVVVTDIGSGVLRNASPMPSDALVDLPLLGLEAGDLVRFDGRGPMFELIEVKAGGFSFKFQGYEGKAIDDLGYTDHNTPWPAVSPVRHTFEMFRKPVPSGSPLSLAGGLVIDLSWSGIGPSQVNGIAGTYQRLCQSGPISTVSFLFDGTGRLRQAVVDSKRIIVTGLMFLLVGRADRAGQDPVATLDPNDDSKGANWQYADSFWVGVDPQSGVAKVAECVSGAADVAASQAYIRQSLLTGGR
jgi:prepilin-type N-terminal cleavage/methylation domain-containing protein